MININKINKLDLFHTIWNEFRVTTEYYQEHLISMYKSIPGRRYDPETKDWIFPISMYVTFKNNIHQDKNVLISKDLSKSELEDIAALYEVNSKTISVYIPDTYKHIDEVHHFFENKLNGWYNETKKFWIFKDIQNVDQFIHKLEEKLRKYSTPLRNLSQKPKEKSEYNSTPFTGVEIYNGINNVNGEKTVVVKTGGYNEKVVSIIKEYNPTGLYYDASFKEWKCRKCINKTEMYTNIEKVCKELGVEFNLYGNQTKE